MMTVTKNQQNRFNDLVKISVSVALISASALGLTACAKQGAQQSSNGRGVSSDQNGRAQTYSLNGGNQFKIAANGERINPLSAPANQSYYFDFDSNVLKTKFDKALAIQANYLVNHPSAKVRLSGNTDPRGSREYNIGLGLRRDVGVANYLEQQGVRPSQIVKVSYGKEFAYGGNESAWRLDRRVDLKYVAY